MNISVILCTYNRHQELAKALESVTASNLPDSVEWEVLVVDNKSTDRTREVVEAFVARYGERFRYIFEERQGKSYALNTGIRQARGEVLAFLDDDVVVDQDWLHSLTSPMLKEDWVGAAGRVFPERDLVLPSWIKRDSRFIVGPLVMFDLGPNAAPLNEVPFGTNMAFRKTVFQKHGDFRTDLGPRPGSEIRGEDSEFVFRLFASKEPLRYEPAALVYHSVSENRLTKKYFLAWWFDKGRSEVRAAGPHQVAGWSMAGVPLAMIRRVTLWLLKWMFGVGSPARFEARLTAWYLLGKVVELYHERRGSKAQARQLREYRSGSPTTAALE